MCGIGCVICQPIQQTAAAEEQLKQSAHATQQQKCSRLTSEQSFKPSTQSSVNTSDNLGMSEEALIDDILYWVTRRGPDAQQVVSIPAQRSHFLGCVLSQRGEDGKPTLQPYTRELGVRDTVDISTTVQRILNDIDTKPVTSLHHTSRNIPEEPLFMWNAEVFAGAISIPSGSNDTKVLYDLLYTNKDIVTLLDNIQGPFATIYVYTEVVDDMKITKVFFARDKLGRRSLVMHLTEDSLCLSNSPGSVGSTTWHEVPCTGVFVQTMKTELGNLNIGVSSTVLDFLPWPTNPCGRLVHTTPYNGVFPYRHPTFTNVSKLPLLPCNIAQYLQNLTLPVQHGQRYIYNAVKRHVDAMPVHSDPMKPAIGVLFSGGQDCTLVTAILHHQVPPTQPIELISVAFAGEATNAFVDATVPDRVSSIQSYIELCKNYPTRKWLLVKVNITLDLLEEHRNIISILQQPQNTIRDFNIMSVLYFGARGKGLLHENRHTHKVDYSSIMGNTVRYDGDESIENTLAKQKQEKKTREKEIKKQRSLYERDLVAAMPDDEKLQRKDLTKSMTVLYKNTSLENYQLELETRKEDLDRLNCVIPQYIAPLMRVEDLFPLEEKNQLVEELTSISEDITPEIEYTCLSRVLLLGSGADEQFAGYGRHRTAWKTCNRFLYETLYKSNSLFASEENHTVYTPNPNAKKNDAEEEEEEEEKNNSSLIVLQPCSDDENNNLDIHPERLVYPGDGVISSYNLSQQPCIVHQRQQRKLRAELNKDVHRLWVRNLGRDDRAVAFWGKEARQPLLDEDVMHFITLFKADWKTRYFMKIQQSITYIKQRQTEQAIYFKTNSTDPGCTPEEDQLLYPLEDLCNMFENPGIGDKKMLRQIAYQLNVQGAGKLVKRAMQFGTKMANKHVQGNNVWSNQGSLRNIVSERYLADKDGIKPGQLTPAQMKQRDKQKMDTNAMKSLQNIREVSK